MAESSCWRKKYSALIYRLNNYKFPFSLSKFNSCLSLFFLSLLDSYWLLFESCSKTEHYLVESSHTSETFLVKWSKDINPQEGRVEWDGFLVLRIDEEGDAVYTEDFGGVCIFLSKAEPFCLPTSDQTASIT
ncbi:hypothetical protein YC2023_087189 [Brassica napus]